MAECLASMCEALGLTSSFRGKGKWAEEMGWWVWCLLQCKDLSLDPQSPDKAEHSSLIPMERWEAKKNRRMPEIQGPANTHTQCEQETQGDGSVVTVLAVQA